MLMYSIKVLSKQPLVSSVAQYHTSQHVSVATPPSSPLLPVFYKLYALATGLG